MLRRPKRSTHCISSAASDVYKRQAKGIETALSETFKRSLGALSNPYDPFEDGAASRRIKNTLKRVKLDAGIREKWFFDIDEVSPLGGTSSPTKGLMG